MLSNLEFLKSRNDRIADFVLNFFDYSIRPYVEKEGIYRPLTILWSAGDREAETYVSGLHQSRVARGEDVIHRQFDEKIKKCGLLRSEVEQRMLLAVASYPTDMITYKVPLSEVAVTYAAIGSPIYVTINPEFKIHSNGNGSEQAGTEVSY